MNGWETSSLQIFLSPLLPQIYLKSFCFNFILWLSLIIQIFHIFFLIPEASFSYLVHENIFNPILIIFCQIKCYFLNFNIHFIMIGLDVFFYSPLPSRHHSTTSLYIIFCYPLPIFTFYSNPTFHLN